MPAVPSVPVAPSVPATPEAKLPAVPSPAVPGGPQPPRDARNCPAPVETPVAPLPPISPGASADRRRARGAQSGAKHQVRLPCPPETLRAIRPVLGPSRASIGIADQTEALFADERFGRLGLRVVRRSIGWDALQYGWQTADVDEWLAGARRRGVEPLITFARSRVEAKRHTLPTPAQFTAAFRAFRQRYPWVRQYSSWNEANHCGEARSCRRPDRIAAFYKAIKLNCAGCKVLAADLLDTPNMIEWVLAFKRAAREEPKIWGLHNYVSANRFDPGATTALLQHTTGRVWLTETGGLVARRNASPIRLEQGPYHAVRVTRFIFQTLARLSPRIQRVYLYHWKSATPRDTWDSAFVGADNRPRPSLGVLQGVVSARRAALGRR